MKLANHITIGARIRKIDETVTHRRGRIHVGKVRSLECGDLSPLLYFGSCSHQIDYQSGDKSPHSKVATALTIHSNSQMSRSGD